MNIGEDGQVATDHSTIDSYSTVALDDDVTHYGDYSLYANTITVTNGGMLMLTLISLIMVYSALIN